MGPRKTAQLKLQDGSIFDGISFGADVDIAGEVVFNTGMMGYPETLTDPSYRGQILVLTYPLIGNYGIPNDEKEFDLLKHFESDNIHIRGLVIADYSEEHSHWNADKSLGEWLKEYNIPAIYGVDTRALTKKLREHGVMLGSLSHGKEVELVDPNVTNLTAEVSCVKPQTYEPKETSGKKIILVDCGVKNNIIRCFLNRGVSVKRVPWNYDFLAELECDEFDGLFISNGPGDPKQSKETIAHLKKALALKKTKPIFGICLGSQILSLAAGADTYKLKYGHRSQNQPCVEVGTKRCYITSQNHGYAVKTDTLPTDWKAWFVNNNDGTNEGVKHNSKPFFAVQFHPESYPGPEDTAFLFDRFIDAMNIGDNK